ncbi:MAG: hypothetical protein ABI592_05870 [Acidobacteriota bacterium]
MTPLPESRPPDIFEVLDESLPVIDAVLVQFYGYEAAEAEAFKDTLATWFHRVVHRPAGRAASASELREQLLYVACKYARAFRVAQVRTGGILKDDVTSAVAWPVEEVAMALLHSFEPRGRRP